MSVAKKRAPARKAANACQDRSAAAPSPFPPIADFAFLSDCHTGALVAPDGPGLMRRAADRDVLAQIERARQQMRMEVELVQQAFELGLKPPVTLHVVLGEVEDDPAVAAVAEPV